MRVGSGSRHVLDMLGPWKVITAIMRWTMVLLLLPRHLPRIDLSVMNSLSARLSASPSSSYTPYSSSAVMVVDAEKVANPTDQFDIDDSYLRVTIRHQTFHEIPSCQHRITQIELHNLHSDKELIINSIQMVDEITKLLRDDENDSSVNNQHRLGKSQSPELIINDLPQQLYMSKLPADGELRLGPGQVAIIPVAFLPRYPLLFQTGHENIRVVHEASNITKQQRNTQDESPNVSSQRIRKPNLSPYQRADWEECMDNMKTMVGVRWDAPKTEKAEDRYYKATQHRRPHRNNLQMSEAPSLEPIYMNERFRLTTAIIIDTNRGNFHCPFEIVSRRYNLYGLPDFIMFDIPDSINISGSDDYNKNSGKIVTRGGSPNTYSHWQDDEAIDEDDQRIKETIELFRAVKEKEKWTLSHSTGDHAERMHNNNGPTLSDHQYPLENDSQRPLDFHGRSNMESIANARFVNARVVDRILQQSDNDSNPSQEAKLTTDYDCYDLYLRNPDPTMLLKVSDILVSKSKLINLYVIPDKHNETFEYTHPSHRHITDWSNRSKPIFGKADGSLVIPGDGEHHYVVTICAATIHITPSTNAFSRMDQAVPTTSAIPYSSPTVSINQREMFLPGLPEWIDIGVNGIALGFLQIKTSQGTFFVSLVKANETIRRHRQAINAVHLQPFGVEPEVMQYEEIHPTTFTSAENVGDEHVTKILKTSPESIDFTFVTSSLSSFEVPIDISNISPDPFTIMRFAVALDDKSSVSNSTTMRVNVKDDASQTKGIELRIIHFSDALSKPILAGSVVRNATSLLCSVDWSKLLENSSSRLSLELKGALIIRGTTEPNLSYVDWLGTLKTGSLKRSNFVVEVPLTIKVEQGIVGFLVEGTSALVPSLWAMKKYTEMLDIVSAAFFPHHPSLHSAILTDEENERMRHGYSKGADHQFRIFNDVGIDVELSGVDIAVNRTISSSDPSLCERFDAYIVERGPSEHIDLEHLQNMGLIHVRYRYADRVAYPSKKISSKAHIVDQSYPVICSLQVTTDPPSGIHAIDFVVYSGQVSISKHSHSFNSLQDYSTKTMDESRNWYKVITGLENVVQWFRTTKAGFSLRSVLQSSADRNNDIEEDTILLSRYLHRLAQIPDNPERMKLKPVLLSVGGLEQGESTTVPLYITNFNPVPVKVKIAVGGVEGQSISLGRNFVDSKEKVNTLLDKSLSRQQSTGHSKTTEPRVYIGRFRGHPINGLRDVLKSNKITQQYLQRFGFRDDITMSHLAVTKFPYLKKIYEQSAISKLRVSLVHTKPTVSAGSKCDDSENPPMYGEFHKRAMQVKEASTGPIIISSDRKTFRHIKVCWDTVDDVDSSDRTNVVIPAGGVARFDVSIRAPSRMYLPKDITQFVATGLVLTTDHGELIPVLVTFKALRGGLELSPASVSHDGDHRVINVPIKLFGNSPSHDPKVIRIPPQSTHSLEDLSLNTIVTRNVRSDITGLALFAKSSFSRDVHLRKIDSCNTCFSVDLGQANTTTDIDPFLGVHIGAIRSVIPCNYIEGLPIQNSSFPSFFRCALDWLTKRGQLQPAGCGRTGIRMKEVDGLDDLSSKKSYDTIVKSVRRALLVSEWSDERYYGQYGDSFANRWNSSFPMKSGRRSPDGIVSPSLVNAVTDALKSLEIAAKLGHMTLGTNLRAVVDYSATPDEISPIKRDATSFVESNHTLSLAIDKTVLMSPLGTPQLLNHENYIGVFYHGDGRQRIFFPPTAFGHVSTINIPLRNPTGIPVRVRLGIERHHSRTQFESPYVQQIRKSDVSPLAWANEQWWDRGGAFFQADYNGNVIRSPYNVSVKSGVGAFISTMNPSVSSNVAFLNGCGPRCGIIENDYGLPLPVAVTDVSPIGAAAAAGEFVTGSGNNMREFNSGSSTWQKRFAGFAGASFVTGGDGPAAFALPYSALDEIVIPPFGEVELGPVLFRPPGRTRRLGCDAMMSKKDSDICRSQSFMSKIFIENSLTGIEEVAFEGKALWEKIVFFSPDSKDGFDDIELRNGHPTLIFPSVATSSSSVRQPTIKQVVVCNEGDVSVTILNGFLSAKKRHDVDIKRESSCEFKGFRIIGCNDFHSLESFELLPGRNRSIYIEYSPNVSRKRTSAVLHFDLVSKNDARANLNQGMLHTFQNHGRFTPSVDASFRTLSLSLGQETVSKPGRLIANRLDENGFERKGFIDSVSLSRESRLHRNLKIVLCLAATFLLVISWFMLMRPKLVWFRNYSTTYHANLIGSVSPPVEGQNWRAMFRSLGRVNPSTCDLQSIGRDQTRHMILARLKHIGAMQPQCFNSAGVPKRERVGTSGSAGRQVNSVSGYNSNKAPANERVRMSDAIFGKLDLSRNSDDSNGLYPVRLGWRCAALKGIIDSNTLKASPIMLMTEDLLRRRTLPIPARIQAVTNRSSFEVDSSSTTSGLDSSIGDLSIDETLPNDLPEIVSYDRGVSSLVTQSVEHIDLNVTTENSINSKPYKSEMHRDDAMLILSEHSSEHRSNHGDQEHFAVTKLKTNVALPTDSSGTEGIGQVISRPHGQNKNRREISLDGRTENNKAKTKFPSEKRNSTRSANTTSQFISAPKSPIRREAAKAMPPITSSALSAASDNSSNALVIEKVKASDTESKTKTQNVVARAKSRPEKTRGRSKGVSSTNPTSTSRATKSKATEKSRPNEGIDTPKEAAALKGSPPPRLLPPPGFNEDLTSPDRSHTDSLTSPRMESTHTAWKASNSSNTVAIDNNGPSYQIPLGHTAQSHLNAFSFDTPPHISHQAQLRHDMVPMDDAPLPTYTENSVPTTNTSHVRLELPLTADAIMAPISLESIPYGSEELDIPLTSTATTPIIQSTMVPGFSALVPSFSVDTDDPSNSMNHHPHGASSTMMDFDVMDFLDQILEEGHTESGGMDDSHNPTTEGNNNTGMILNNIVPMASINPWSMDASENSGTSYPHNMSSRAAAYGIAFDNNNSGSHHYRYTSFHNDDEDDDTGHDGDDTHRSSDSHNVGAVPFLQTPLAIMASNIRNPENDHRPYHHNNNDNPDDRNSADRSNIHPYPTSSSSTQPSMYGGGHFQS